MKNITKGISMLIILGLLTIGLGYIVYNKILNTPINDDSSKRVFIIDEGMIGDDVLEELISKEIIDNKQSLVLKIYIRTIDIQFKAGTYKIPLNISPKEIIEVLKNPELTDIWITIPEGYRKDEIAKLIAKEYSEVEDAAFSETEFLNLSKDVEYIKSLNLGIETKDLEGFLFPDKYLMPAQATTDYIIKTLTSTFKQKVGAITYKQLIIASMLEREGKNNDDRPMIADVIYKRLNEGWLLQIDATLLYYYKDWKHTIIQEDKQVDQPYNTYKRVGLIPTPICNPGLSSINAAKNPEKNSYYYYIHGNNGIVYFARTLAEHNANIAKYLR